MNKASPFDPTREEIDKAVKQYLEEGGTIKNSRENAKKELQAEIMKQIRHGCQKVIAS